ncbi:unnamed protein product, partial [Dibothriocephalus latus]
MGKDKVMDPKKQSVGFTRSAQEKLHFLSRPSAACSRAGTFFVLHDMVPPPSPPPPPPPQSSFPETEYRSSYNLKALTSSFAPNFVAPRRLCADLVSESAVVPPLPKPWQRAVDPSEYWNCGNFECQCLNPTSPFLAPRRGTMTRCPAHMGDSRTNSRASCGGACPPVNAVPCASIHHPVTANRQVEQAFAKDTYAEHLCQPIICLPRDLFKYCPPPSTPPPQRPLDHLILQHLLEIRCDIETIQREMCEEISKARQPSPTMQETPDDITDTVRRLSTPPAHPPSRPPPATNAPEPPPPAPSPPAPSPSAPPPPPPAHARQSL